MCDLLQTITGPIGAILASNLSDVIGWFGMFALVSGFTLIGIKENKIKS
jgi:hypothetical protein